ncbi:MAG: PHP domain-containing protein [Clostridia bacterium]|nr:PHP domain-containing protein [Clostridia bacterium]
MSYDAKWVARCLREIADLSELLDDDAQKAPAYRRAARAVEETGPELARLAAAGRLTEIPHVGPAIAAKVEAILATGTCPLLERLRARVPEGVRALLGLPGVGPKTVGTIWRELGVTSPAELAAAARAGRLQALPGFGPKKERALLEAAEAFGARSGRMLLGEAFPVARVLVEAALQAGATAALEVGEVRRREPVVGAIDLAVACDGEAWAAWVEALRGRLPGELGPLQSIAPADDPSGGLWPAVLHALGAGVPRGLRASFGDVAVRWWWSPPDAWGWALLVLTGPAAVVSRLFGGEPREALMASGGAFAGAPEGTPADAPAEGPAGTEARPDPYGFRAPAAEAAVFSALGREWVPPELRAFPERVARLGALSELVSLDGWAAELHAHTAASDGRATLAEMARAARDRGYRALAVTDHSFALRIARGLDAERLRRQAAEVEEVQREVDGVRLLRGTEADIRQDGSLDVPEGVELEWIVASIHSAFSMSCEAMTARVVRALESGRVDVLGHPTGRLLLRREGYDLDLDAVFDAARRRGTAMEINANPARLDLDDGHAFEALRQGLALAVNTDAHSVAELDHVVYGVWMARRAGARRAEVLNLLPPEQLLERVRRRHGPSAG